MSGSAERPRRPPVLVLTSTFPRWAGDHEPPFVHDLSVRLADDFDIDVVAPHARGSACSEIMGGVAVHRFRYAPSGLERLAYEGGIPHRLRRHPWLGLLVAPFMLAELAAARRLLRDKGHRVIHAHWLLPQGLVAIACRWIDPQLRIVVTAHGADLFTLDNPVVNRIRRWALRRIDCVTVVSGPLADRAVALGCDPERIRILPMGADLSQRFTPAAGPRRAPILVFAGRLVAKKGVSVLLQAMPLILAGRPDARLRIAGFGPEEPNLKRQAGMLGIADRVEFLGPYRHKDLPAIYRGARLALFPFIEAPSGDREGLGLVVVEALGCGLPVIAGDIGGVRDAIIHDETGLLVAPGDPAALAAAVLGLLGDEEKCRRLAQQGRREAVRRFDWPAVRHGYREVLLSLAGGHPDPAASWGGR